MKTMKVPVGDGRHEIEVPSIRGLPIDTEMSNKFLSQELAEIVGFLALDWEGHVYKIIPVEAGKVNIETLDVSYFEPADKGTLSLFAYDADGEVILGMTQYTGEGDIKDLDNPVQRGSHIYIVRATATVEKE